VKTARTAIAITAPTAKLPLGRATFTAQAKAASRIPSPAGATSDSTAATKPTAWAEPTSGSFEKGM